MTDTTKAITEIAESLTFAVQEHAAGASADWLDGRVRDAITDLRALAEQAAEDTTPRPVDPELFRRTAPAYNCIDYPGDGPHYTPDGTCLWCGKATR